MLRELATVGHMYPKKKSRKHRWNRSISRAFKTIAEKWGEGKTRLTFGNSNSDGIRAKSIMHSLEFSTSLITRTFIYIQSFTDSLFLSFALSRVSYKLCTMLARVHGLLILTLLPLHVFSRPLSLYLLSLSFAKQDTCIAIYLWLTRAISPLSFSF